MKKLFFFLLLLVAGLAACRKSGSDTILPLTDGRNCKIQTMTSTLSSYKSFAWLYYDSFGNLSYTKSVTPLGDTLLGVQYKYSGKILQYSFFSSGFLYSDTVYYFFDGADRLERTIEQYRTSSAQLSTKTDFFYNPANQVICTVASQVMGAFFLKTDSTLYGYTGKNVTTYTQFEKVGSGAWRTTTFNMAYDSMKNYYKATGMPADSYLYWSENNMIRMNIADSTSAYTTINITKYNDAGYPVEMTEISNTTYQIPVTLVMTYECK